MTGILDEETATLPVASADVARYLANLTSEMVKLARENELDMLAYFLEMARIEAQICARMRPTSAPGNDTEY